MITNALDIGSGEKSLNVDCIAATSIYCECVRLTLRLRIRYCYQFLRSQHHSIHFKVVQYKPVSIRSVSYCVGSLFAPTTEKSVSLGTCVNKL